MFSSNRKLKVGTRDSMLARLQTDMALESLRAAAPDAQFEILAVKAMGDKILDRPLSDFGGRGVFVKELEESLLAEEVDLVVHSLKDVPSALPEGLILGAVLKRDDPRDVLVSKSGKQLKDLPAGSVVATSSRRRSAQVKALRGDLRFTDVRGNIQTRLNKLDNGVCDAMILAAAGLLRLGLKDRIAEFLEPEVSMPAAGQGALAIECRSADKEVVELLTRVCDQKVLAETTAERAFLCRLGGGCSVPAGVLASESNGRISMFACITSIDGSQIFKDNTSGKSEEAEKLGFALAEKMLKDGAESVIAALKDVPANVSPP